MFRRRRSLFFKVGLRIFRRRVSPLLTMPADRPIRWCIINLHRFSPLFDETVHNTIATMARFWIHCIFWTIAALPVQSMVDVIFSVGTLTYCHECGSVWTTHRPVYEHAPAILAAPAVYCIHGRIIHQARGCQTVQNVNEKHAPSPSAATANMHWPSNCSNF